MYVNPAYVLHARACLQHYKLKSITSLQHVVSGKVNSLPLPSTTIVCPVLISAVVCMLSNHLYGKRTCASVLVSSNRLSSPLILSRPCNEV